MTRPTTPAATLKHTDGRHHRDGLEAYCARLWRGVDVNVIRAATRRRVEGAAAILGVSSRELGRLAVERADALVAGTDLAHSAVGVSVALSYVSHQLVDEARREADPRDAAALRREPAVGAGLYDSGDAIGWSRPGDAWHANYQPELCLRLTPKLADRTARI